MLVAIGAAASLGTMLAARAVWGRVALGPHALARAATRLAHSDAFLPSAPIRFVRYGVLGTRLTISQEVRTRSSAGTRARCSVRDERPSSHPLSVCKVVRAAPPPSGTTAFVDPAGLPYIQQLGPRGAAGAAGAIYSYLCISNDASFPPDVVAAVTAPGAAKHHRYELPGGDRAHCVHVAGADLRAAAYTWEAAVSALSEAYEKCLLEFYDNSALAPAAPPDAPAHLRLLPISGGIFAGEFAPKMPQLTRAALDSAQQRLPAPKADALFRDDRVVLCLFTEGECDAFAREGFVGAAAGGE